MSIELDIEAFRLEFYEFDDREKYTDGEIDLRFKTAKIYISDEVDFTVDSVAQQTELLYLMTAHLLRILEQTSRGGDNRITQSTSVGSVSISLTPPPAKNQYSWWLSTTPYGQRLLALKSQLSAGGFYLGGSNVSSGFRGEGGYFG